MEPPLSSIKGFCLEHRIVIPVAAALLALSLAGCSSTGETGSEGSGNEGPGEHAGEGEGSGGHDSGGESSEGDGEESATQYGPGETYDMVRAGARLILRYDAATQTFVGTVENTTSVTLSQVRVEVHLSNGVELGPTMPRDLAPGETIPIHYPGRDQPNLRYMERPPGSRGFRGQRQGTRKRG